MSSLDRIARELEITEHSHNIVQSVSRKIDKKILRSFLSFISFENAFGIFKGLRVHEHTLLQL